MQAMTVDLWMTEVQRLINGSTKDYSQARAAVLDSNTNMPFFQGEKPLAACWLNLNEPEIGTSEDTMLIASQNRLVLSTAGGWTRSAWSYWFGIGAVTGVSIGEWTFTQSDNWGNHARQNFVRVDMMFRNLDSITVYKQFDGPKNLVPLARAFVAIVENGVSIGNDSDDFLMAYNAVTAQ